MKKNTSRGKFLPQIREKNCGRWKTDLKGELGMYFEELLNKEGLEKIPNNEMRTEQQIEKEEPPQVWTTLPLPMFQGPWRITELL